jgi:predicted DNA-binding WGR domain protein
VASVKAYRDGDVSAPAFPDAFTVDKKAVLQVTDIKTNRNKYYAIELHVAGSQYRVFTHYGRTDDLETNPNAGAKEGRFFDDAGEALACYESIFREKTSAKKGYKEVSLASSKIGSQQARGTSSGQIDDKTVAKLRDKGSGMNGAPKPSSLPPQVQNLVSYIYAEATEALTTTVAAKITANGIETPLGVLTIGQIERGELILQELYKLFESKTATPAEMETLSGEFYTAIPHRLGRTRAAISEAVIDSMADFDAKQETLQLMKDMLAVSGDGAVLFDARVDAQYSALRCNIAALEKTTPMFRELEQYVLRSQLKSKTIKVENIYTLMRDEEWGAYDGKVGNERLLYHGSRIKNWVGLLSRGILLPKIVVSMGVHRTDPGWLGNGIYFGDAACTSAFYTTAGKKGTRFMAIARVALGKMAPFTKITYGLSEPPSGFDSCHGVRNVAGKPSQFADDEFVVYRPNRQRMEALVEFTA